MKAVALPAILCLLLGASVATAQTEAPVLKPGNGVSVPTIVSEVKPSYPPDAMAAGIEGSVMLEFTVETDGSVSTVRVVKSLDPLVDEAAIAAVKQWRFKAGVRDGKPVRVAMDVEMTFTTPRLGPRLGSNDVFKPGPGVTAPAVLREVKPSYTAAAKEAGIQGTVWVDCVVLPDGTVGDMAVTKSLDPGLDAEAIRAMKRWRFAPGKRRGEPVPVQVSVEITFTLK